MVDHQPPGSAVGPHLPCTPAPLNKWQRRTSRRTGGKSASDLFREFVLRTASHNFRSLRQPEAIELVLSYMLRERIDVLGGQESWLPGFFIKSNKGHIIINMNKEGAHRRGVSIFLAPAAVAAWDRTGRALCKPSDRVLAVRLSYTDAKGKAMSFCVTSAYRPLSSATELEHEEFGDALEEAMQFAQPNDILLLCIDGNGSIGCSTRDSADFDGTVGPRGIKHSNAAGADLLNIFRAHGLCSTTSFRSPYAGQGLRRANLRRANAKMGGGRRTRQRRWRRKQRLREAQLCAEKRPEGELTRAQRRARAAEAQETLARRRDVRFASWTSSFDKKHYQLDYILVQQPMLSRVRSAYVSTYSGGSDHRLLRCDVAMARSLARVQPKKPQPTVNRAMLKEKVHRDAFIDAVAAEVDAHVGKLDWPDLDAILVDVAEKKLTRRGRKQRAWFAAAEDKILWAQAQRNMAFAQWNALKKGCVGAVEAVMRLRAARKTVRVVVREARVAWMEATIARIETVKKGGKPMDPSDAWKAMQQFADGMDQTVAPRTVPLIGANDKPASTDKEQLRMFVDHFDHVYNRTSTYDPTVLGKLAQRPTWDSLGTAPGIDEVAFFLRRASNEKAKGLSGVAAEYYKAISHERDLAQLVTDLIGDFWSSGQPTESWKLGRLKEIGKAGKDLSNPSNYRGVMLLEAAAKTVSAIINARLQKLLTRVGRESQAGFTNGRGCPDSTFSLKNVLQTLREHGQESWVCFIDLVKAFDSVDRTAMCDILLKYGAPQTLVSVIAGMHAEVNVRMEVGDEHLDFESKIGVLQGAAASPVIFLFVISAWFETMDWPHDAIVMRSSDGAGAPQSSFNKQGEEELTSFIACRKTSDSMGTSFTLRDFLYADDAALIWLSRKKMQAGMQELVAHGKRWGLQVHVAATADGSSKTEFIVVPPLEHHPRHRRNYDRSPVKIGDVFFTHASTKIGAVVHAGVFKYLGSYICEDLSEDFDITERISKASGAFGRFKKCIFANKALSIETKARAFTAFVLSILFYQSECWALREDQLRRVEVFFNRCIRCMTGINSYMQWCQHLTSEAMAARAGLRTCASYLDERCLRWVGHVARMDSERLPRKTLFAWYLTSRAVGRPKQTFRHRLHRLLRRLPDGLSVAARSSLLRFGWLHATRARATWDAIVCAHCGIVAERREKNDPKTQHLEGKAYQVKFRDEEDQGDGGESAFDRLVRIGN